MGRTLAIYVERLRLARQLEDDTVEGGTQVGSSNRDALRKRQGAQPIAREESGQKVECGLGLMRADGSDAAFAIVRIVRCEGRSGDVRERT